MFPFCCLLVSPVTFPFLSPFLRSLPFLVFSFPFLSFFASFLRSPPLLSPLLLSSPLQPDRSHYLHKGRFMIDSTFNPLQPRWFSDHASFAHKTSRPLVLAKNLDVNVEVMMNHFAGGIIISTRYQSPTRTPHPPSSIETRRRAFFGSLVNIYTDNECLLKLSILQTGPAVKPEMLRF